MFNRVNVGCSNKSVSIEGGDFLASTIAAFAERFHYKSAGSYL